MNVLAGYRVMLGMTQADMAEYLGISKMSYNQRENGRVRFSKDEMIAIKNLFRQLDDDLTIDNIFFTEKVSKS